MIAAKGITISVDFGDLLRVTLVRNARHLTEIVVVTHPRDLETQAVVAEVPNARCHLTEVFYANGAKFNKGAAMEEGFHALGKSGWVCIFDADTLLPEVFPLENMDPDCLYSAYRRILDNPRHWHPGLDWTNLPLGRDLILAGYLQLFHADATALRTRDVWYPASSNAAMCDTAFELYWPVEYKHRLPCEVLHLGQYSLNWVGRITPRLDGAPIPEAAARLATMKKMRRNPRWPDA